MKAKEVINKVTHPNLLPTTLGQKSADKLTRIAGSWGFIISFGIILVLWITLNSVWMFSGITWDPKPFILLNLVLSCLAAFQAPIILMSQNRQGEKDRQRAEYDYAVNRKAERGIRELHLKMEKGISQLNRKLDKLENKK